MFCREVCEAVLIQNSCKIGGTSIEVQIDEAKFGKRKYNRGRLVTGQWVFGGSETQNRTKMFMVPVPDRTSETFINLIEKYIEKGSVIVSDCWKSYENLGEVGYKHLTVNHSLNFKDPETGAHTNIILKMNGCMQKSQCQNMVYSTTTWKAIWQNIYGKLQ